MKNYISKTIALTVAVFIGASLTFANTDGTMETNSSVNEALTGTAANADHKKHHQKKAVSPKVQNQTKMKNMAMKMKKQNTPVKKNRMGMKKKSLKKKSLKKKPNMKNMKMDKDKKKMEDMDM